MIVYKTAKIDGSDYVVEINFELTNFRYTKEKNGVDTEYFIEYFETEIDEINIEDLDYLPIDMKKQALELLETIDDDYFNQLIGIAGSIDENFCKYDI